MTDELTYFKGTHRVIAPKKTIEINEDKLKIAGITRIADITDLDRIGLPIYTAIRPTAEDGAISIYGGKGITKDHAKASAMMEGFERYSAEKQDGDEVIVANIKEHQTKERKRKHSHRKRLSKGSRIHGRTGKQGKKRDDPEYHMQSLFPLILFTECFLRNPQTKPVNSH